MSDSRQASRIVEQVVLDALLVGAADAERDHAATRRG